MWITRTRHLAAPAMTCAAVGLAAAAGLVDGAGAAPAKPPRTVTATRITRPPRTLAPGSRVKASSLGHRAFPDARHGFALASVGQAQYPAATADGGRTWRTDGPALHLNAAQGPLVVTQIGAASARTVFAYGGGNAIDTTANGGRTWYRALFTGITMAVVTDARGHLVAFVDGEGGGAVTAQYVSRDGGRSWHYDTTIGGS